MSGELSPTSGQRQQPQIPKELKDYKNSILGRITTAIADFLGIDSKNSKLFHASELVNQGIEAHKSGNLTRECLCFHRAMHYLHGTELPGFQEVETLATQSLEACKLDKPQMLQDYYIVALQAVTNNDPNAAQKCLDFFENLEEAMGAMDWKMFAKENKWLKDCDLSALYNCMEKKEANQSTKGDVFVQFCRYYGIGTQQEPHLAKNAYEHLSRQQETAYEAQYHLAIINFRAYPTEKAAQQLNACNTSKAHYQLGHYYWAVQEILYGTGKLAHLDDMRDRKELRRKAIRHFDQAKKLGHKRAEAELQEHTELLGKAAIDRILKTKTPPPRS